MFRVFSLTLWILLSVFAVAIATVNAGEEEDKLSAEIQRLMTEPQIADIDVPKNQAVLEHLAKITGQERLGMEKTLARAPIYKALIEKKLVEKKMPPGLIAVVMQESAFAPEAVSRTGAAGLWQFKPATARLFNLRYDAFVDERFDAEAATKAALKYLSELHAQFNDWALALAAYNWGRGSMARTMDSAGIRNFWTLCKAGKVRAETAGYVPGIYARLLVWREPEKYGFDPVIAKQLETFELPPLSDLQAVEKAMGAEPGALKKLNPQLLAGYTPPYASNLRVFVTPEMKKRLEKLMAEGVLNKMTARPGALRAVRRIAHRVKRGDTIWGISQRYKTCVQSVLDFNGWKTAPALSAGMTVVVYQ